MMSFGAFQGASVSAERTASSWNVVRPVDL